MDALTLPAFATQPLILAAVLLAPAVLGILVRDAEMALVQLAAGIAGVLAVLAAGPVAEERWFAALIVFVVVALTARALQARRLRRAIRRLEAAVAAQEEVAQSLWATYQRSGTRGGPHGERPDLRIVRSD
jgi:hypothetical protein